jgi:hypothetical protein
MKHLARGLAALLFSLSLQAHAALTDLWWSGPQEDGWGVSIVQHGETLFAVIYAYDDGGYPTWYVMSGGSWNVAHTAYAGNVYQPRGSSLYQYSAACLNVGAALGTLTLTFSGESSAVLDYAFGGATGRKNIVRQPFGPAATPAIANLGDMWWGGAQQNGWGIAILQQGNSLFSIWFTYDGAGTARWYVMPAGAFTSADTYQGRLYRTTGSTWLGVDYDPALLHVQDVGTFRVRFTGTAATFDYQIEGIPGSMPLVRQPF